MHSETVYVGLNTNLPCHQSMFYFILYQLWYVMCLIFFFKKNFKSQLFYKGCKNNTWPARCIYLLLRSWACKLSFLPRWPIEFIILLLQFYQLCSFFIPFFLLLAFFYHWAFRKKWASIVGNMSFYSVGKGMNKAH